MSKITMFIIIFVLLDLVATGVFSEALNWIWFGVWGIFILFLIIFHFGEKKTKRKDS